MRKPATRIALVIAVTAAAAACAAGTVGAGGGSGDVLTYEELIAAGEPDLFRAIQRLRPQWLRTRGSTSVNSATVVTVFIDGSPRGDVSALRGMPINEIRDVERLSASEAAFRFGTLAGSGGTLAIRTSG